MYPLPCAGTYTVRGLCFTLLLVNLYIIILELYMIMTYWSKIHFYIKALGEYPKLELLHTTGVLQWVDDKKKWFL